MTPRSASPRTRRTTFRPAPTLALGVLLAGAALAAPAQAQSSDSLATQPQAGGVDTVSSRPLVTRVDAILPAESGGLRAADVASAAAVAAPSVQAAQTALDEASTYLDSARSTIWPRLDLAASYVRRGETEAAAFEFGGQSIDSPFPQILNNYTTRATLTVPLSDIFLRALPAYEAVGRSVDVVRLQQVATRQTAAWQGREAYYQWLQAVATARVAARSGDVLAQLLVNVQALADAGVVPSLDVITTQANVARARTGAQQAQLGEALAAQAIRILAGWDNSRTFTVGETLDAIAMDAPPAASQLVEQALERRAEVQALEALTDLRNQEARIQRVAGWPSLQLQGNVLYANPNQAIVPAREEFDASWDVGVTLSWSPNALLQNRAAVDRAHIAVQRVDDDLRAFTQGLHIEAAQAVQQWSSALVAIDGARTQLVAIQAEFDARTSALHAGIGTTSEVLEAEARLASAQLDLASAYISLHRAHSLVARLTGQPGYPPVTAHAPHTSPVEELHTSATPGAR